MGNTLESVNCQEGQCAPKRLARVSLASLVVLFYYYCVWLVRLGPICWALYNSVRPFIFVRCSKGLFCFQPTSTSGRSGWTSLSHNNGGIKLNLDLVIGESNQIESTDKGKLEDIATRIKDLNARLKDIRREQIFQRVCTQKHFSHFPHFLFHLTHNPLFPLSPLDQSKQLF